MATPKDAAPNVAGFTARILIDKSRPASAYADLPVQLNTAKQAVLLILINEGLPGTHYLQQAFETYPRRRNTVLICRPRTFALWGAPSRRRLAASAQHERHVRYTHVLTFINVRNALKTQTVSEVSTARDG
jgi:hypothetical protein